MWRALRIKLKSGLCSGVSYFLIQLYIRALSLPMALIHFPLAHTVSSWISFNRTLFTLPLFGTSFAVFDNQELKYAVLACMDSVDKKYREKEHASNRDATSEDIAYKRYMANNGVHPLMMRREQALYLDTFSANAQLFYLAFAFVDGTDGIANGIARNILSYVGRYKSEDEEEEVNEIMVVDHTEITINVRFEGEDGFETYFKLRRSMRMRRLMNKFAEREGFEVSDLIFLLHGTRIDQDTTPEVLGLVDGDQIDAFRELLR
jgi:hypothetical protein